MNRPRLSRTPFVCPVCGESLAAQDKACPECGACERSGWNQDQLYDGLDLPDHDRKLVRGDFGGGPKLPLKDWMWRSVALLLIVLFVWSLIRRGGF